MPESIIASVAAALSPSGDVQTAVPASAIVVKAISNEMINIKLSPVLYVVNCPVYTRITASVFAMSAH